MFFFASELHRFKGFFTAVEDQHVIRLNSRRTFKQAAALKSKAVVKSSFAVGLPATEST